MSTETKLVNGMVQQVEKKDKPLPTGTQYTEVRVRHFYTNDDNGMIVMPTVVYFIKDGAMEADMEIGKLSEKLRHDINEQLPFTIRNMTEVEIAEELAKEISVGSLTASQGKAALGVFAKNLPDEKPAEAPAKSPVGVP